MTLTEQQFNKWIERIKEQESKYNVEIDISGVIDKDHLDCIWYDGMVGTIKCKQRYKGYTIVIGAYGSVFIDGKIKGTDISIKDEEGSGQMYKELGASLTDEEYYKLTQSTNEVNYLHTDASNWFEVNLMSPEGEFVDLHDVDNILCDNILSCFEDVSSYFGYIDWAQEVFLK